jgi:hypothetical protein
VTVGAFFLLYIVVLLIWEMPTRYLGVLMLPSFVFIGFGLEKIVRFLRSRWKLRELVAVSIVCVLILGFSLPKSLNPRETDKRVFKEIGELIAEREGNEREIVVASCLDFVRWISFYANLNYKGAPCPQKNHELEKMTGNDYQSFLRNLKKRKIQYVLWDEKHWPEKGFQFLNSHNPGDFRKVGAWHHFDAGRMILFEVL